MVAGRCTRLLGRDNVDYRDPPTYSAPRQWNQPTDSGWKVVRSLGGRPDDLELGIRSTHFQHIRMRGLGIGELPAPGNPALCSSSSSYAPIRMPAAGHSPSPQLASANESTISGSACTRTGNVHWAELRNAKWRTHRIELANPNPFNEFYCQNRTQSIRQCARANRINHPMHRIGSAN